VSKIIILKKVSQIDTCVARRNDDSLLKVTESRMARLKAPFLRRLIVPEHYSQQSKTNVGLVKGASDLISFPEILPLVSPQTISLVHGGWGRGGSSQTQDVFTSVCARIHENRVETVAAPDRAIFWARVRIPGTERRCK
jgi:hypothetical protein